MDNDMKNVSMSVTNYNEQQLPAQSMPPLAQPSIPSTNTKKIYSVSFSVQFDNEAEALKLAATLLNIVTGDND